MKPLLSLSRLIDALSERVGRTIYWLVLAAVLISAANATVRKIFNMSSNAFLEIQWYLFAAVFLLCAGYTLLRNEHVRIDVVSHRLSKRKQMWIDIIGIVLFLFPLVIAMVALSLPFFYNAYVSNEMSSNAGGLVRWPVIILMPIGFALLGLQGISELIKRIAFLKGLIADPTAKGGEHSAEEELAAAIRAQAEMAAREGKQ